MSQLQPARQSTSRSKPRSTSPRKGRLTPNANSVLRSLLDWKGPDGVTTRSHAQTMKDTGQVNRANVFRAITELKKGHYIVPIEKRSRREKGLDAPYQCRFLPAANNLAPAPRDPQQYEIARLYLRSLSKLSVEQHSVARAVAEFIEGSGRRCAPGGKALARITGMRTANRQLAKLVSKRILRKVGRFGYNANNTYEFLIPKRFLASLDTHRAAAAASQFPRPVRDRSTSAHRFIERLSSVRRDSDGWRTYSANRLRKELGISDKREFARVCDDAKAAGLLIDCKSGGADHQGWPVPSRWLLFSAAERKHGGRPQAAGTPHEQAICEAVRATAGQKFPFYVDFLAQRREPTPSRWKSRSYASLADPDWKKAISERKNHIARCTLCRSK